MSAVSYRGASMRLDREWTITPVGVQVALFVKVHIGLPELAMTKTDRYVALSGTGWHRSRYGTDIDEPVTEEVSAALTELVLSDEKLGVLVRALKDMKP